MRHPEVFRGISYVVVHKYIIHYTEETSIVWSKDADAIMESDGMKLSLNKRNTLQPIMFCIIILARVKPA